MDNFAFHNPTKILFGTGQIAAVGQGQPVQARQRGAMFGRDVQPQRLAQIAAPGGEFGRRLPVDTAHRQQFGRFLIYPIPGL